MDNEYKRDTARILKVIETARKERHWNVFTLAGESQIPFQTLYPVLSGARNPRITTVHRILDALGMQLTVTRK